MTKRISKKKEMESAKELARDIWLMRHWFINASYPEAVEILEEEANKYGFDIDVTQTGWVVLYGKYTSYRTNLADEHFTFTICCE